MMATDTLTAGRERLLHRLSRRFSVQRMSRDRVDDLCAFFQQAYADQPIGSAFQDPERIVQRWRWLNEANPVPFDDGLPAWVCLKGEQMVGHFAVLPALAVAHGQAIPVCWGRDLIVAPQVRHQGVGPLLITTAVTATQRPFLIAGLNETVYPIYRRLGFQDHGTIPLYLKVYQPQRLLETLAWPRLVRWMAKGALTVTQRLTARRPRGARRLSLVPLEQFDERFDQWWRKVEGELPCVIRRTSATMTWRYLHHPAHRYTALAAMEGKTLRGIVIVRHGRSRGLPAGFITELLALPHDQEAIDLLLACAQEHLVASASEPLVFIRCAVFHRAFEHALGKAGFLKAPSPIHWMATHAQGVEALGALSQRSGWFLNAGDADLDVL